MMISLSRSSRLGGRYWILIYTFRICRAQYYSSLVAHSCLYTSRPFRFRIPIKYFHVFTPRLSHDRLRPYAASAKPTDHPTQPEELDNDPEVLLSDQPPTPPSTPPSTPPLQRKNSPTFATPLTTPAHQPRAALAGGGGANAGGGTRASGDEDDDSEDNGANGDVDFHPPSPPYADIYGDHSSASSDEFADALSTPMRTANVDGSDSDTERTLIKAEDDEQEPDLEFEDMPGLDLDGDRLRELLEDPDPAPPRPPRGAAAPLAPRIPDRVTPPRAPPPISPNHGRGRARPVLPPRETSSPAQRAHVVLRPPRLFLPPVENQEEGDQGLEAGGPTRRAAAAGRAGPPAQILPPAAPLRGNDPAPGAVPDAPHRGQQVEAGQEEVPAPRLSAQQRDYLALREERAQRAVARAQQADDRAARAARRRGVAQGDQEEIEEEEEPPAPDGLAQEGQD